MDPLDELGLPRKIIATPGISFTNAAGYAIRSVQAVPMVLPPRCLVFTFHGMGSYAEEPGQELLRQAVREI
jgi:hypothetical protein